MFCSYPYIPNVSVIKARFQLKINTQINKKVKLDVDFWLKLDIIK